MNIPRGWAAFVIVLVVAGAAVWALRANPLLSLWALLGALAVWEVGRRSRYRHSLRFLPPPRSRTARSPARVMRPAQVHGARARSPWHRSSGAAAPARRPAAPRPQMARRPSTQRRP
jgi:hypothetical protein